VGFLSTIASIFAYVPAIGSYLAALITAIQAAIENWIGYTKILFEWLWQHWKPWVESWIDWLYGTIDYVINTINNVIKPAIAILQNGLAVVIQWYEVVKIEINEFVANPTQYIDDHMPVWIKTSIADALSEISDLWNWITTKGAAMLQWVSNAPAWFLQQLDNAKTLIWNYVYPHVKPFLDWINNVKTIIDEFVKNPVEFIDKHIPQWVKDIPDTLIKLKDRVEEIKNAIVAVILNIDNFLKEAMVTFIQAFILWWIYLLLKDLFTLEYNYEKKEIIGEIENPITWFFIKEIEIDKPKYEYESVEEEVTAI